MMFMGMVHRRSSGTLAHHPGASVAGRCRMPGRRLIFARLPQWKQGARLLYGRRRRPGRWSQALTEAIDLWLRFDGTWPLAQTFGSARPRARLLAVVDDLIGLPKKRVNAWPIPITSRYLVASATSNLVALPSVSEIAPG